MVKNLGYEGDIKRFLHGIWVENKHEKSKLYGVSLNPQFFHVATNFLTCKVDSIPFKFLRLIVGGNPGRLEFWNL